MDSTTPSKQQTRKAQRSSRAEEPTLRDAAVGAGERSTQATKRSASSVERPCHSKAVNPQVTEEKSIGPKLSAEDAMEFDSSATRSSHSLSNAQKKYLRLTGDARARGSSVFQQFAEREGCYINEATLWIKLYEKVKKEAIESKAAELTQMEDLHVPEETKSKMNKIDRYVYRIFLWNQLCPASWVKFERKEISIIADIEKKFGNYARHPFLSDPPTVQDERQSTTFNFDAHESPKKRVSRSEPSACSSPFKRPTLILKHSKSNREPIKKSRTRLQQKPKPAQVKIETCHPFETPPVQLRNLPTTSGEASSFAAAYNQQVISGPVVITEQSGKETRPIYIFNPRVQNFYVPRQVSDVDLDRAAIPQPSEDLPQCSHSSYPTNPERSVGENLPILEGAQQFTRYYEATVQSNTEEPSLLYNYTFPPSTSRGNPAEPMFLPPIEEVRRNSGSFLHLNAERIAEITGMDLQSLNSPTLQYSPGSQELDQQSACSNVDQDLNANPRGKQDEIVSSLPPTQMLNFPTSSTGNFENVGNYKIREVDAIEYSPPDDKDSPLKARPAKMYQMVPVNPAGLETPRPEINESVKIKKEGNRSVSMNNNKGESSNSSCQVL